MLELAGLLRNSSGAAYRPSSSGQAGDEIEVLKLVLAGGMVEFHGEFYDFDRLQISPAPEPVRSTSAATRTSHWKRAARVGDGWTSAMMNPDQPHGNHRQAGRASGRIRPRQTAVRDSGRLHRPFDADGHQVSWPTAVASPTTSASSRLFGLGYRRPGGEEDRLDEAVRRDLHHSGWQD